MYAICYLSYPDDEGKRFVLNEADGAQQARRRQAFRGGGTLAFIRLVRGGDGGRHAQAGGGRAPRRHRCRTRDGAASTRAVSAACSSRGRASPTTSLSNARWSGIHPSGVGGVLE